MEHRSSDTHVHAIGGNFLVLRAHYPAHSVQLCFAMVSESSAVEMPNASEANPFAFLSKGLLQLQHPPTALKMSPAQNDDLSSLCMNYLSYELNR
ncbi:MAG: hypothetical protein J6I89_06995, partial [Oscillospiraceae bacterium]|nr:hypothetical protein [Oscillospiraceae bacterium]